MASKKVVETIYGKYHKYEIVRKSGMFNTKFYIRYNGKISGNFNSLAKAVKWAEKKG